MRRFRLLLLGTGLIVGILVSVLMIPVSMKQGVNYSVSTHSIPLYAKAAGFLYRDSQYRLKAMDIVQGLESDEERILDLFEWTREHVKPTPDGFRVVDDHILDIMIRGYGESDQMADVFTTLATYAGIPAFWTSVKLPHLEMTRVFSFAKINERWCVFDVESGVIFKNSHGDFATLSDLHTQSDLSDKDSYKPYVQEIFPLEVPNPLRAELQMPIERLVNKANKLLGR